MNIFDETWDKCPYCRQTNKLHHGDFHESRACQRHANIDEYNRYKIAKLQSCFDAGVHSRELVEPPVVKEHSEHNHQSREEILKHRFDRKLRKKNNRIAGLERKIAMMEREALAVRKAEFKALSRDITSSVAATLHKTRIRRGL